MYVNGRAVVTLLPHRDTIDCGISFEPAHADDARVSSQLLQLQLILARPRGSLQTETLRRQSPVDSGASATRAGSSVRANELHGLALMVHIGMDRNARR